MRISFTPQRRDDSLIISKQGDVFTVNGEIFDFSSIPDGASLPADAVNNSFFFGDIERINGELHIGFILPHGFNAPEDVRFPEDIVNPPDGQITLPGGGNVN